jgi:hypothetical protein
VAVVATPGDGVAAYIALGQIDEVDVLCRETVDYWRTLDRDDPIRRSFLLLPLATAAATDATAMGTLMELLDAARERAESVPSTDDDHRDVEALENAKRLALGQA